jgi:hypothetical protein
MKNYSIKSIEKDIKVIVVNNADGSCSFIPFDEANTDYQQYLAWVAEGNTATEWSPEA